MKIRQPIPGARLLPLGGEASQGETRFYWTPYSAWYDTQKEPKGRDQAGRGLGRLAGNLPVASMRTLS